MTGITLEQFNILMSPLRGNRVQTRSQGGKTLSYLASYEVKAHLTRIFGFGNWDAETVEYRQVGERFYTSSNDKEMVEVIYSARVTLRIRDTEGNHLCTFTEAAAGSASGPVTMLGEHHDNAIKTAESDAIKRCAINLGSQFGLSLYDNGSLREIIQKTLVTPEGWEPPKPDEEQVRMLQQSLGATEVTGVNEPNVDHTETVQA